MVINKIDNLNSKLRKIVGKLNVNQLVLMVTFFIISHNLFATNDKVNPLIEQAWGIVFNEPQKALDVCLPELEKSIQQKDSLLIAELNRLIGTAYYNISEYEISLLYFTKSLNYFYQQKNIQKTANLYNDIALCYLEINKNIESRDYLMNSLSMFKKINKKNEVSLVLTNIGLTYFYSYDYVRAVSYYLKALAIADKANNKEAIAMLLNNIAVLYKILKNHDKALTYYQKAHQIFKKNNELASVAATLNNIGGIYFLQDKVDSALKYYNESLEIKKKINNKSGIAITLNNIGEVYEKQENYSEALNYFEQSLKIKEEIKNFQGAITTTDCIAKVYYKQKNLRKAELFFLRSVELGKIAKLPTKTSHYFLSELYKDIDNYEKSLFHLQKFASVQDSVIGSEKVQQINELLANYETAKKDEEITTLTESNRLKEQQIRERTIFLVVLSSFFATLIILIVILFRYSKKVSAAKDELNETNIKLLETNAKLSNTLAELQFEIITRVKTEQELLDTQKRLAESLESAKELNELKTRFIAMISHQYRNPLTVIMNIIEMLPIYKLQKNSDNHSRNIKIIKDQIIEMVQLLNDTLIIAKEGSTQQKFNIMTMPLDELCKDVITNAKYIDEDKHNFILNTAPGIDMITTDLQLLTHALTNIVSNSAKYSPWNTDINIDLMEKDETFIIKVKDQGIGIPEEDKRLIFEPFYKGTNIGTIKGNGLGLSIVKMFLELLDGKVEFESKENLGTTFTLTLPKVLNK